MLLCGKRFLSVKMSHFGNVPSWFRFTCPVALFEFLSVSCGTPGRLCRSGCFACAGFFRGTVGFVTYIRGALCWVPLKTSPRFDVMPIGCRLSAVSLGFPLLAAGRETFFRGSYSVIPRSCWVRFPVGCSGLSARPFSRDAGLPGCVDQLWIVLF